LNTETDLYKTITFFFSDIEGSTKLLQKLGDKYSGLLDEQQKILKEEFQRYNGKVSDVSGDGFFVIFETAKDAVDCAASIQKKISGQQWIDGVELKIRMGIHTGEAKVSQSGFTGLDVHRAARIMSAGHGGQVLISEATKELVENNLSDLNNLKSLGSYNLKDILTPEKIYQLVIDGLNSEFPPLKSSNTLKTNLPSRVTKIIGREAEFQTLKEILTEDETKLVTLTGPGGMGKTTFSLNVCSTLIDSFEDGVYVIFLSAITDIGLVSSTIGRALGLSESKNIKHLIEFLADKNLLLFLDNFEQVIGASGILGEIILNCPRVKILVTSRVLLNIKSEKEFALSPLSLPGKKDFNDVEKLQQFSAIQLFIDRAKSIDKNFQFTHENGEAIAKICIQLDGLPLAIELACARLKLFTPQMLLSRLSSRLNILKVSRKDFPERHQTLRQTIMWSYDLLPEEEKKLFEALSVFTGGCTLEAIEKTCGDFFKSEYDLFDAVQALVDKNLLRRFDPDRGEPRFNMLFTIREFSNELFEKSVDFKKIKDKHSYYYLENAEEAEPFLTGKDIKYWSDLLDADVGNFRTALSWSEADNNSELALRLCASLWRFWIVRRNLKEGYEKMKYVLSMPYSDSQKQLRAKALNGLGTLSHELNDYEVSLPLIEESIKLYQEIGDKKGKMNSMINLFWVLTGLGELDKAEKIAQECLKMNEELNDVRAYSLIYNNLGWVNFMRGNLLNTRNYYSESLNKRIELGDKRGEGFALSNVGWVEIVLGNYEEAEKYFIKAIGILKELSDKQLIGWALSNYGFLEVCKGNFQKAEELIKEAISQMRESLHEWSISYETLLYGLIRYYRNDKKSGIEHLKKGLLFYKQIKNKWGTKRALFYLGNVYYDLEDFEKSKECFREGLEISIYLNDKLGFVQMFESTALLCIIYDNMEEARMFYEAALSIREEIKAPMNYIESKIHHENLEKLGVQKSKIFDLNNTIKSAFGILKQATSPEL